LRRLFYALFWEHLVYGFLTTATNAVVETKYRAKSAEGKVRHPFFKGIREDL